MPLYEYECDACGHRFEHIHQKFSDPPIEKCPKCGGAVHKLMSSPAIQFKGSGFYITDYAKKEAVGAGKSEGSEGKGDAQGGTKSEGGAKTESKGDTPASSSSGAESSQSPPAKPPAAPTKPD